MNKGFIFELLLLAIVLVVGSVTGAFEREKANEGLLKKYRLHVRQGLQPF